MTIPQRTVTITGVFAEDAATTIPEVPVAGTSYRDTSMTTAEVTAGWPYKAIVDSAQFNQAMYQYSKLTKLIETYGFLPWSALTDYETGSICLGSDGVLYQASQTSGPSSTAYDPVNDNNHIYWNVLLESIQLGIGDVKQSLRIANHGNWFLCNGQAISRTNYPVLFSIIGTTFGVGDGSTTFNLPDYRGKFLRGLGGDSAANMYTTQVEGLPNITQSDVAIFTNKINDGFLKNTSQSTFSVSGGGGFAGSGVASFSVDASRSNAIYGASNHVTPINQAVNYFIRVG